MVNCQIKVMNKKNSNTEKQVENNTRNEYLDILKNSKKNFNVVPICLSPNEVLEVFTSRMSIVSEQYLRQNIDIEIQETK